MIAALALTLQAVIPPVFVPPAPPAPPAPPRLPAGKQDRSDRMRVDVVLRTPEAVLWQGTLTLANGGASWRESVSEAGDCSTRYGDGAIQREASVQLYRQRSGSGEGDETVQVNVRWVRPADGAAACGSTRTVELRQSVDLSTGPARLVGDGGLVVELRRR